MEQKQHGLGVVIVDDAQALRSALRGVLIADGYHVLADMANGHGLLEAIERLRPAIVCLDINLPGIDGLTLLQEIHASYREVAVVMITGSTESGVQERAAEAGAAGFIRKPFSQEQILDELRQVAHAQRILRHARKHGIGNGAGAKRMARAIVVDDSDTMRQLLSLILTQAGVEVLGEACNGDEAVRLVTEHRPDLVFLDYEMPVMNGLEALQIMRQQSPESTVVMITAVADREMVKQAAAAGARGYILKPYRPDRIAQVLGQLLTK